MPPLGHLSPSHVQDCIEMREIEASGGWLPEGVQLLSGPLVQRQVFLRGGRDAEAHVYAASWWNAEEVRHRIHRAPV